MLACVLHLVDRDFKFDALRIRPARELTACRESQIPYSFVADPMGSSRVPGVRSRHCSVPNVRRPRHRFRRKSSRPRSLKYVKVCCVRRPVWKHITCVLLTSYRIVAQRGSAEHGHGHGHRHGLGTALHCTAWHWSRIPEMITLKSRNRSPGARARPTPSRRPCVSL